MQSTSNTVVVVTGTVVVVASTVVVGAGSTIVVAVEASAEEAGAIVVSATSGSVVGEDT
jgi:hypothetical protein